MINVNIFVRQASCCCYIHKIHHLLYVQEETKLPGKRAVET